MLGLLDISAKPKIVSDNIRMKILLCDKSR